MVYTYQIVIWRTSTGWIVKKKKCLFYSKYGYNWLTKQLIS